MIGQGGWVRAAVTTTAIYLIVELPTTGSMAAPMPASPTSSTIGQGGWVRAAVTTTAIYLIVELPTTGSMAAPMPASTSSRMAGSRTRTLEVGS